MKTAYVYIAGPLSVGSVAHNVGYACGVGWQLMKLGYIPFVPHLTHFWELFATDAGFSPRSRDQWLSYDEHWLSKCDVLLRLPGKSPGADREALFAIDHYIPVVKSVQELLEKFPLNHKTSARSVFPCGRPNCPLCYGAPRG